MTLVATIRLDDLRLAAALAHTVRGVTLEFSTDIGRDLVVAYHRLDAALDPCRLRHLVAATRRGEPAPLLERLTGVRVAHGAEDLGGGIFRSCHGEVEQRWIPTLVPHETVLEVLAACPIDPPGDALQVRVAVDTELAATTLCLTAAHRLWEWRLDELAVWAHGACLVAELTAGRVEWPAG